jgi:hypothetical protein
MTTGHSWSSNSWIFFSSSWSRRIQSCAPPAGVLIWHSLDFTGLWNRGKGIDWYYLCDCTMVGCREMNLKRSHTKHLDSGLQTMTRRSAIWSRTLPIGYSQVRCLGATIMTWVPEVTVTVSSCVRLQFVAPHKSVPSATDKLGGFLPVRFHGPSCDDYRCSDLNRVARPREGWHGVAIPLSVDKNGFCRRC